MDEVRLEAVDEDVPVTQSGMSDPLPRKPNLGFER